MERAFGPTIKSAILVLLICGCSGGANPANPNSAISDFAAEPTGHQSWGTWDVAVDADSGVTIVPLRTAEFNANVVKFLQPPMAPINLLTMALVSGSDIPNGYLVLDITLRHPFNGLGQYRGFDVRGIILTKGGIEGLHDPTISYRTPDGARLLNADGYTRWWNQVEFTSYNTILGYTDGAKSTPGFLSTATLNPYKLFADGLASNAPLNSLNYDSRATFSTNPGVNTRRYRLQFKITDIPKFGFRYSIDASWSLPDPSFAPDYPVEAFDLSANCQEPYFIQAPVFEEMPYFVDDTTFGGDAVFLLTVGDWQASSPDQVLSQLSHIWIESPMLFDTPVDVLPNLEFVSSNHHTQATFRCTLTGLHPTSLTDQWLLITAESANPDTYAPQINGDPGAFAWPDQPLAAFALVDVPISDEGPQQPGDYWIVGLPDWCSLTEFCTDGADNLQLITNLVKWDLDGPFNDNSMVKWWEGHVIPTPPYSTYIIQQRVESLNYTFTRTSEPAFDPTGCRMIIIVLVHGGAPNYPPFTDQEVADMKDFVKNGGVLCVLIENPNYFDPISFDQLMDQLGAPLGFGGYAEPPSNTTVTTDITPHYLTSNMLSWQYWTCGEFTLESPDCISLIRTAYGEHVVVLAPIDVD